MRRAMILTAATLVVAAPLRAQEARLRILAGGSLTAAMDTMAPRLAEVAGRPVEFFFGATPQLIAEAVSGRDFDLGVVPADVFLDAAARARFAPDPTVGIARVGYGVAVPAGAVRPDIGSADALRRALLAAPSVAMLPSSAAGAYVLGVFDRLGIGAEMRAKLRAQTSTGGITAALLNGEAAMAVFLTNVLAAPGVELVGPFPPELQQELVFEGAIAAGSSSPEAAAAVLAWLRGPEAQAALRARGLTPG